MKKVKNVSEYWEECDFDTADHLISWNLENLSFLNDNTSSFLIEYLQISLKYGILVPPNIEISSRYEAIITKEFAAQNRNDMVHHFNGLYYTGKLRVFSNMLYVQKNDAILLEKIVNTDLLYTYDTAKSNFSQYTYAEPVKITFVQNYFHLGYRSDAFLFTLNNRKTNFEIDNSETAYLNTTRYNSFLRDFYKLCIKYKATEIEFENSMERYSGEIKHYTQNGILCGGEVIYYEDIYDLLPEEHKYKLFEKITLEL